MRCPPRTQISQRLGVNPGAQIGRQVHPDRHHEVGALRFQSQVVEVAAEALDRDATPLRQLFCSLQPYRTEIVHTHAMTKAGQINAIATLTFRQTKGIAGRQLLRLIAEEVVGLTAIGPADFGVAAAPEATWIHHL